MGVVIIIIGFSLQNTTTYSIGEYLRFGADFYTEIYDVTRDVGRALNNAINDLICAISWLVVSLGAIDVCFFVYKFVKACTEGAAAKSESNEQEIYEAEEACGAKRKQSLLELGEVKKDK